MKLEIDESDCRVSVVPDSYGEEREKPGFGKYTYLPLPICRVPCGHGRTFAEAVVLAERIMRLLEAAEVC